MVGGEDGEEEEEEEEEEGEVMEEEEGRRRHQERMVDGEGPVQYMYINSGKDHVPRSRRRCVALYSNLSLLSCCSIRLFCSRCCSSSSVNPPPKQFILSGHSQNFEPSSLSLSLVQHLNGSCP